MPGGLTRACAPRPAVAALGLLPARRMTVGPCPGLQTGACPHLAGGESLCRNTTEGVGASADPDGSAGPAYTWCGDANSLRRRNGMGDPCRNMVAVD